MSSLRAVLLAEALVFLFIGIAQTGLVVPSYSRPQSAVAAACIAVLLIAGWTFSRRNALAARQVALVVQSLAILGSLFGAALLWLGIGPRTPVDLLVQHGLLVVAVAALIRVK